MSNTKKIDADASNPSAPVVPTEKGKSIVVGFHYFGKWCHITLKNGVTGIVGDSTAFTFSAMLSLKGSGMMVSYERLSDSLPGADGRTFKRYRLEWSLE